MRITAFLVLSLTACALDDLDEVATTAQAFTCPNQNVCTNSPELVHYGMHEAHLRGQPNAQGITIFTSKQGRAQIFKSDGTAYDLYVVNSRILGKSQNPAAPDLVDQALVGSYIWMFRDGQPLFWIRIKRVRDVFFGYTPPGAPDMLHAYVMKWGSLEAPFEHDQSLCNALPPPPRNKAEEIDQLHGLLMGETIVFAGDRFNVPEKTISKHIAFDPRWFNFGCAGHTQAKMHMIGQTEARQINGASDEAWAERQSTLKALVADYCGRGTAYTVFGERIVLHGGTLQFGLPPSTIEARWDENGATCIGSLRLDDHPDVATMYPGGLKNTILSQCARPIPSCSSSDPTDLDGARRVSANYIPVPD